MATEVIRMIYSRDRKRRVVLFRRSDGTFGFEAEHFSDVPRERCWIPAAGFDSRTPSVEVALREAIGRVNWLAQERTGGKEYRLEPLTLGPIPHRIGNLAVVCYSPIDDRHRPTGNCLHYGMEGQFELPAALAICTESDDSFYLFYCDQNWCPIADTWHASLEDARNQAEFEYEGIGTTWEVSA